jgi:hypothetical protein
MTTTLAALSAHWKRELDRLTTEQATAPDADRFVAGLVSWLRGALTATDELTDRADQLAWLAPIRDLARSVQRWAGERKIMAERAIGGLLRDGLAEGSLAPARAPRRPVQLELGGGKW